MDTIAYTVKSWAVPRAYIPGGVDLSLCTRHSAPPDPRVVEKGRRRECANVARCLLLLRATPLFASMQFLASDLGLAEPKRHPVPAFG